MLQDRAEQISAQVQKWTGEANFSVVLRQGRHSVKNVNAQWMFLAVRWALEYGGMGMETRGISWQRHSTGKGLAAH